jgi:hypothetical protein
MIKGRIFCNGGRRNCMVVGFTQLPMQSVPLATNIKSSNPIQARCTRYNIMFVSDLRQVCGFLQFPPQRKLTATI